MTDHLLIERVNAALRRLSYGDEADRLLDELKREGLRVSAAPTRAPAGAFTLHNQQRQPIIVHGFGCAAAAMQPAGELAFILDIAGPRNRPPSAGDYAAPHGDTEERYLLSIGQTAELIVELLNAARNGGDPVRAAVDEALEALK